MTKDELVELWATTVGKMYGILTRDSNVDVVSVEYGIAAAEDARENMDKFETELASLRAQLAATTADLESLRKTATDFHRHVATSGTSLGNSSTCNTCVAMSEILDRFAPEPL